jgi:uncharacterized protein (TIGR02453 family)
VFPGFPHDTQAFLRDVREHNDKTWFDGQRDRYERAYVEPARAFVVATGERLAALAPELRAEPRINGSIFRINRDTRFSKDKTPYKSTLDFWFWEGSRRAAITGLFVRVAPELVAIGAGCHGFDAPRLARYREALLRPAARDTLTAVAAEIERAGHELGEVGFKRLPRAVEELAGTPAEPLGRMSALFVAAEEPALLALDGSALLDTCERHWRVLLPLHHWLAANVQPS